ncbi:MAG: acylphosphatase [Thermoplasmatales archaeon]|nr:acylphosphatase [Thermoplasmatales archaeon]
MIRGVITIFGDVQGAGYRAHVMKMARNAKLVGYVENILDGTVKVVCEGEKERIENFVSGIKIKTEIVEVEDIKVDYNDATGEFEGKGFDIQVEESFKGMIRELFQGYVTSEKYFNKGFEKQDKMLEKQDETIKVIGNRFDDMDIKYGDLSKTMASMNGKLDKLTNLFEKLVNHFVKKE